MEALFTEVIAIATTFIMGGLRKVFAPLNTLPPIARTLIVSVLAFGTATLSGFLGTPLPADPTTWDGVTVNGILTALLAMGTHAGYKAIGKT